MLNHRWMKRDAESLHNLMWVPKNFVRMKISCWVKPEVQSLFSISFAINKHVCL